VVPAAHYACGGVLADLWGCTTIEGLYAVGEVSCTGVHGANRLASTSLLEGLLWGDRVGRHVTSRGSLVRIARDEVPPWEDVRDGVLADPVLVYRDRRTIQTIMWLYVGLARNTRRLGRALRDLNHLWEEIDRFYRASRLSDDLIGLRNLAQAAWVVTRAAWHNRQSRGAHYREDAQANDFASLYNTESLDEPWF
jgi:L-aspartate oxidase